MKPKCLVCGKPAQVLMELDEHGIPHGEPGHNVAYSYAVISVCGACGHGVLEKYSHDCWDYDEDWDMYWWYALAPGDVAELRRCLTGCPNPLNHACDCPVHVALRKSSEYAYGGVRHAYSQSSRAQYAWLTLEVHEGMPKFVVDKDRGIGGAG
ncbi:MAG: hypothetical protein JXA21_24365 [Anaerolineae bacterium]|nr:hypothetical protein [Anaerolineae bacterium]